MLMDLRIKSTSNCGYMHYTIAVSLEMSDEPDIIAKERKGKFWATDLEMRYFFRYFAYKL